MPTYSYECEACGRQLDAVRPISERRLGPTCCGTTMGQVILHSPMLDRSAASSWDMNYKCLATGQEVTSPKQRKEILAKNGLADVRDFDLKPPDPEQAAEEHRRIHESAKQEIPADLAAAMRREGLDSIL